MSVIDALAKLRKIPIKDTGQAAVSTRQTERGAQDLNQLVQRLEQSVATYHS